MRKLYFLPQGANIAAYRNVAIVSDSAAVSEVVFTSGGSSNYPDPHFMVRPHSTNVVRILVGTNYTVTSDAPISCVWKDDEDTLVWTNSERWLTVHRPLRISGRCLSKVGIIFSGSSENSPTR